MVMDEEVGVVLVTVTLLAAALAGCTNSRYGQNGTEGDSSDAPASAGLLALPENTDGDAEEETVLTVSVKDGTGAFTDCECGIFVEVSDRVELSGADPTEWTPLFDQQVQQSDFGLTGVDFVVDDGQFCGWRVFRVTVTLTEGSTLEAETKTKVSCDGGGSGGYADNGDRVRDIKLSAFSEDTDSDPRAEANVSVTGKGQNDEGEETRYRFEGSLQYVLKWDSGADCLASPYRQIASGELRFAPSDFSGSVFTAFHWAIQDDKIVDGESYDLYANVTVNATGQTYPVSDSLFASDEGDSQKSPAPPDEAEAVQSLSVLGSSSNEDSDAANEMEVSVWGEGEDDYTYCRFNGTIDLTIEHKEGYGDSATYTEVASRSLQVTTRDFSGVSPEISTVFGDHNFQDSETYRITSSATMEATGDTFQAREETFYYED